MSWARLTGIAWLALGATAAVAQVPAGEQVATFSRVFTFDRALAGESLEVLLVGPEGAASALAALADAFRGNGAAVRTADAAQAAGAVGSASVVYFLPGTVTPEARSAVARAGALSIAGEPSLAVAGQVSVALDPGPGRTGIVVNLPRLEAEGHAFSPQLLKQPWVRVSRDGGAGAATTGGPAPPCRITRFDTPSYPAVARRMEVEGTVRLRVLVGPDLAGQTVEVVEGVRYLDEAAVRAATRSQYGAPGWCSLAVPFRLSGE